MSDTTGRLELPYILQSQSQKEVTHNEALTMLDMITQAYALDVNLNTPPGSPAVGDMYIVGASPTGAWLGKAHHLAQAQTGGVWFFVPAFANASVWVESAQMPYRFDGSAWVPQGLLDKSTGDYLRVGYLSEDVTVSGASTSTTLQIPDRATVLGVNVRVITAISGATSFDVGVSGATSRYGSGVGVALDSSNIGLSNSPLAYYTPTPIILTASGGSFSGGVVRTTVQYLAMRGPWNW